MYVCKSLFKHGKSSVKLKLKTKTNYNCFTYMIAVWESDISATFLIFRLKCSTDAAFFKFLGKLFHNMALL